MPERLLKVPAHAAFSGSRTGCASPSAGRRCPSHTAAPRSSPTRSPQSSAPAATRRTSSRSRSSGIRVRGVLTQAFLWRLLDLEEADGRPIDLVVATKFPSYLVRHPEKRVWLVHQFRQAYELDGTELGQFADSREDRGAPAARCRRSTASRSARRRGYSPPPERRRAARALDRPRAEVLPHPPQQLTTAPTGTAASSSRSSRLDRAKRIDLLLEAAALEPSLGSSSSATGPTASDSRRFARERDLNGRVRFEGRVAPASSPNSTRAAAPSTTRRWTRTSAWGRTSRSSPASP